MSSSLVNFPHCIHFEIYLLVLSFVIVISGYHNKREKVREFITEQMRKGYIKLSKFSQTVLIFFVEKKNGKKRMV